MAGSGAGVPADYRPAVGELTRSGSWFDTAKRNVDLIELALKIQGENRAATPAEQALLAKYVGFGSSEIRNNLFPIPTSWQKGQEPDRLIWPDNINEARWKTLAERIDKLPRAWQETILQSTQYAHYTSEGIVRSIWSAMDRLGFTGGKILEPGMGIGTFAMAMPNHIHSTSVMTGIEFDAPTALIARLLSPRQHMLEGDFIKRQFPRDFYDVAIGNPPFSQTRVLADPNYAKYGFMLHDFFFAKTMDSVRPGGVVAFVTSKGTMDKGSDKARRFLMDRADLLGAIRLPSTAFEANAGTSVVTDVLFLRKRMPGEAPGGQPWAGVREIQTKDGPAQVNEYFAAHPEMVLGEQRLSGNTDEFGRRINALRGISQYTVVSYDETPAQLDAKFAEAIKNLPANSYTQRAAKPETIKQETAKYDYDPLIKREGVVYVDKDGTLMRVTQGVGKSLDADVKLSPKDTEWLTEFVGLRDMVRQAQADQWADGDWEKSLAALNKAYDQFRKKHGPINDFHYVTRTSLDEDGNKYETRTKVFKNKRLWREDYDSTLVTALEDLKENGVLAKAKFLQGRTIRQPAPVTIKTVGDALAVSLDNIGKLDLEDVAHRMSLPVQDVIDTLGKQIYKTPQGDWQLADEYLSGDVVKKMDEAMVAASLDPSQQRNVDALKEVIPERLGPSQISVRLGASWVSDKYVSAFAEEIGAGQVTFNPSTETWEVQGSSQRYGRSAAAEYGTAARSPSELLSDALNSKSPKVMMTDPMDSNKRVLDPEATTAAGAAIEKMKERFRSWVWEDSDRATDLVDTYNKLFNNIAGRRFDGSHLTLPGVSVKFLGENGTKTALYPHQLRTIWRQIQTGNTYLAHAVGAGKTIEMIAGGMEQKRLGLINKPMYVVPNHMLEQFANEFQELYPLANIMVADDENFSKERRKAFVSAATLNAPDAIIITHSAFERIGVKEESIAPIRDRMIADLEEELANSKGDRIKRSRLEQQIEQAKQRFDRIVGAGQKDTTVTFEDMGVDFLYVDEAHAYRKLDFATNQKIKGIDPNGSRRALDMYVKTRILESRRPGRSFVFATGTPVTNTMGELYTIMKFFAPEEMERTGTSTFDGWARQFGDAVPMLESNVAGKFETVSRFARFENVPELMSRIRSFMDVLTSESLGSLVKRPDVAGGKPNLNLVPMTPELRAYMDTELAQRLEASRKWKPSGDEKANPDPVINIISDGRFAALDPRFFGAQIGPDTPTKLNVMADKIAAYYKATAENTYTNRDGTPAPRKGSTQIVFYNLGFGQAVAGSEKRGFFNARKALTQRLTQQGVKRSEIAWFDEATSDAKREAIFKAMREGSIRVLIGSAKKMGTGVNVQSRLKVLHYFDAPWYPADVEQPQGRIIRMGNQNPEVNIEWYATEGTYDATMWQMVARKQRFIDQAFSGDRNLRSMEDLSEASQFEQAAALASGDPRAIQLAGLRQGVESLERLQAAHANEQINAKAELTRTTNEVARLGVEIPRYQQAFDAAGSAHFMFQDGTISGVKYEKQGEFGDALKAAFNSTAATNPTKPVTLGKVTSYNGGEADVLLVPRIRKDGAIYNLTVKAGPVGGLIFDDVAELSAAVDAVGTTKRIVNGINNIAQQLDQMKQGLAEAKTRINALKKKIGAPFGRQQELVQKWGELKALEDELRAEGKTTEDAQAVAIAQAQEAAEEEPVPPPEGTPLYSRSGGTTHSIAFREWFGLSQAIDDQGKPLVVYHGSPTEGITVFDRLAPRELKSKPNRMDSVGTWFSDRPTARRFGKQVYSAFLSIQNPKVYDSWQALTDDFNQVTRGRAPRSGEAAAVAPNGGNIFHDYLVGKGYDGIIVTEKTGIDTLNEERPQTYYVAFKPEQIKSTANVGTFDATNPDIRYSRAPGRVLRVRPLSVGTGEMRRGAPISVFVNPTDGQLINEARLGPRTLPDDAEGQFRSLTDAAGNRYVFHSGDAIHVDVAHGLNMQFGVQAGNEFVNIDQPTRDQFVRVAGNTVSYLPTNANDLGQARFARAPTFYSALDRTVAAFKSDSAPGGMWAGYLQNAKGVKAEELEYTGLADWLKSQTGKVTKAQVQDYLRANNLTVTETVLSDESIDASAAIAELDKLGYSVEEGEMGEPELSHNVAPTASELDRSEFEALRVQQLEYNQRTDRGRTATDREVFEASDRERRMDELMPTIAGESGIVLPDEIPNLPPRVQELYNQLRNASDVGTKFAAYAVPGGENYRELLLQLPERAVGPRVPDYYNVTDGSGRLVWEQPKTEAEAKALAAENGGTYAPVYRPTNVGENYVGPHYEQPNIVAHVRFDDRIVNGQKVLFIEEIQSDWHQAGKKQGYGVWQDKQGGAERNVGVPDAPFKTTWPELALKRMVRWAAENGYDRIAWTSGEQQAARYDLSKQVDAVMVGRAADGQMQIDVRPPGNRGFRNIAMVPETKLADTIGKELAQKALADLTGKPAGANVKYEGVDLKVGGEGMKAFYDAQLVATANKLGKKYGARVESLRINETPTATYEVSSKGVAIDGGYRVIRNGDPLPTIHPSAEAARAAIEDMRALDAIKGDTVHSLPLTDALRESVMQGQPLFRQTEQTTRGMPVAQVRAVLQAAIAKVSPLLNVELVQSGKDAVNAVPSDVEGAYFTGSNHVVLVADMLTSPEHAIRVFIHEVFGHLAPDHHPWFRNALMSIRQLNTMGSKEINGLWQEVEAKQPGLTAYDHAAEVLALMAERGTDMPLMRRIIAEVRAFIRSLGVNLQFSEDDLRQFIRAAAGNLEWHATKANMLGWNGEAAKGLYDILANRRPSTPHPIETLYPGPLMDSQLELESELNRLERLFPAGHDAPVADPRFQRLVALKEGLAAARSGPVGAEAEADAMDRYVTGGMQDEKLAQQLGMVTHEPTLYSRSVPMDPELETIYAETMHQLPEHLPIKDRVRSLVQRIKAINWLDAKQGLIDDAASIEALERGQMGGELLDAALSPYKARLATKNLHSVMGQVFLHGVPEYRDGTFQPVPGRKGFLDIFRPVTDAQEGNLLKQWKLWAAANRANRLMSEGREHLFTQAQIDKALKLGEQYPQFQTVLNDWADMNRQALDLAQSLGVIDATTRPLWENNDYVPFYRFLEEAERAAGPGTGGGIGQVRSPIRRLKGGEAELGDILENMAMNLTALIDRSFKADAMHKLVALAEPAGAMTRVKLPWVPTDFSNEQMSRALEKAGILVSRMTADQKEAYSTLFRRVVPRGTNIVTDLQGGKPVYYEVHDPLLLRSIAAMGGPDNLSRMLGVFRGAKHLLVGAVTADPAFMVANLMRDSLANWVQSGASVHPFFGAIRGIKASLAEDWVVTQMQMAGAGGGGYYAQTPLDIRRALESRGHTASILNPKRWHLWKAWHRIGAASEEANRIAVFKSVIAKGGSIAEAAYQARDVLNFSMQGDYAGMRALIQMVPFTNARIQGLYRLYRGARDNPRSFALRGLILLAATAAIALRNTGRKEYEELPEWDKDTYWHFFFGAEDQYGRSAHHIRLPKPFEVGIIFATLPERLFRWGADRDSSRILTQQIGTMLGSTLAFDPIPQLVKPVIEQYANRRIFFNAPIVGAAEQNLMPAAQYTPWTSETARAVAAALPDWAPDWLRSPVRLEAAVNGYTSTLGAYVLSASDYAVRHFGDYPEPPAGSMYDLPVLRRFMRDPNPKTTKYATELYDMLGEANAVFSTIKEYREQGQLTRAAKLLEENRGKIMVRGRLNAMALAIRQINNQMKLVQLSTQMSPEQKAERIAKLRERKNEITARVAPLASYF